MVFKPQTFHENAPEVDKALPPDAALETNVATALAEAGGIDATDVTVTAEGSVIYLRGSVLRAGEVIRAEEVALSVPGVTATVNELRASIA